MEQVEATSSSKCYTWYVVHCKARKELYAAKILRNQFKLVTYVPEIGIHIQQNVQQIPLFSSYFFIQADLQRVEIRSINSSSGVVKVLDFGNNPLEVPYTLIETIQEELQRRNNYHCPPLTPGDFVRVTQGPLEGLSAVFIEYLTSEERARVLLHLLGRLSKVQLDVSILKKLSVDEQSDLVSVRRERRTRGKGRRINKASTRILLK